LPTVIHVGLFTFCFLLQGALRRGEPAGYVSVIAWLVAVVSLLVWPPAPAMLSADWATQPRFFWETLAAWMALVFPAGISVIFPFLTFIYTYHFLNWFSKTELLKWHEVSKGRRSGIMVGYFTALGACLYNYPVGYMMM